MLNRVNVVASLINGKGIFGCHDTSKKRTLGGIMTLEGVFTRKTCRIVLDVGIQYLNFVDVTRHHRPVTV